MELLDASTQCPCNSEQPFGDCCGPALTGAIDPATAEQTMRTRYTAFTLGHIDYILASHHSETRDEVDQDEIERWSADSEWLGLTIEDTEDGEGEDEHGTVTFTARYLSDGQTHNHHERAYFQKDGGRWCFHSVLPAVDEPDLVPVTPRDATGRNDPCPCGSGAKYKKCCAARKSGVSTWNSHTNQKSDR